MTVDAHAPRDVQTTLNYLQPQDEIPYYYIGWEPPVGVPENNVRKESHPVVIHDMRDKQDAFVLESSGFQWVDFASAVKDSEFADEEKIKTVYYTEVEDILKKYAGGAKRVHVFHHIIRRSQTTPVKPGGTVQAPAHNVHADQTFSAAEQYVRKLFPEDAERLLKGRYQIINLWRPIANTVAHEPLAVADFRSINVSEDLVTTRLIYSDRESSMYHVKYNARHRWYYLSDQTPDEAMLIKCFDSDTGKARLSPHTAFLDKTSPADAPQRQSIEVRALVFDGE